MDQTGEMNNMETTATEPEFKAFPKIARLNREIIITEKIDGTNACIFISDDESQFRVGSRNRWIKPGDDNFGFASWAYANEQELRKLGPGTHYGEYWGSGIQRGYGLPKGEKRFSLFNTHRWNDPTTRPACCHVVPIVSTHIGFTYSGAFPDVPRFGQCGPVQNAIEYLKKNGSLAAPGFMDPEGVVVFHVASGNLYKVTCKDDESPKGAKERQ